jgi:hypothetical protein
MGISNNTLLEHWQAVSGEEAEGLVRLLQSEVGKGHELYGVEVTAIARSTYTDDVLYQLADGRVSEVHLTWSGHREKPPWPDSSVYTDIGEWLRRVT